MSPQSQIVAGAMIGAGCMALLLIGGYFLFIGIRRAYRAARAFDRLMKHGISVMEELDRELSYVRKLTGGQVEQDEGDDRHVGGDPTLDQQVPTSLMQAARRRAGPTPFPSPVFDRFAVAPVEEPPPDATVDDTDVGLLNQTDEDLVNMEALENLRKRGIEVEDSDTKHPGITAEA